MKISPIRVVGVAVGIALVATACGSTKTAAIPGPTVFITPSPSATPTVTATPVPPTVIVQPAPPVVVTVPPAAPAPVNVYPSTPSATVWGYYQLGTWIHDSAHVRSEPNTSSEAVGQVFVGRNIPIICSVVGERVTDSVGSSSNWDYAVGDNTIHGGGSGWVPDEFVETHGLTAPRC